ncbi:tetratricopeptide repeat protein [Limibacillus halophilus]
MSRPFQLGFRLLLLLLLASSAWPRVVHAQTYEAGLRAFNQAYYEEAEAQWLPLARSGDLRSQYALGVLYEKRAAADESLYEGAAEWYRRAAAQGHPGAQTNYAKLLANGQGVPRDQALALHYWGLAARQGNALAQYNLGLAYYRGGGVVPDSRRALAWFRRAADAGMADSQFAMGQMNALGVGTARNPGRALTWFELAEKQGHNDAGRQAARLREEGVTPEEPGPPPPIPSDATEEAPLAQTQSAEVAPAEPAPAEPSEVTVPAAATETPEPQPVPAEPAAVTSGEGGSTAEPSAPETIAVGAPTGQAGGSGLWLGSFSSLEEAEVFKEKTLALYADIFQGNSLEIETVDASRFRVSALGFADGDAAFAFCARVMERIDNAFCAVIEP